MPTQTFNPGTTEPTSGAIRRSGTDLLPSHHDWWPAEPGVAPDAVVVKGAAE